MAKTDTKEEAPEAQVVLGPVQPPLTEEQLESEKSNSQKEDERAASQAAEAADSGKD